jgi:hypothetical protein
MSVDRLSLDLALGADSRFFAVLGSGPQELNTVHALF